MGLTSLHPKRGNEFLHKAIDDLVNDSLALLPNGPPLDTILHLYYAFRSDIRQRHDALFRKLLIGAKDEVSRRVAAGEGDVAANVLYSYFNNKMRNSKRRKFREDNEAEREVQEMLEGYSGLVSEAIPQMSLAGLIRTLHLAMLTKEDQGLLLSQVEQQLMQMDLSSMSALELGMVLRGLSKGMHRQPWGSGTLYHKL